jgi:hypothetical protein
MSIDVSAARNFMAAHARVLDRRRFELLDGAADPSAALAALDGYRNPDGGYGWGLEGDLRSPESQPGAALHAFEVFAEIAPATTPQAVVLCDWLEAITLPDGGLPMALPLTTTAGSGPWWASADPGVSSLQITSVVAARAHRVAAHDPAVAAHPWLQQATRYCLDAIAALDDTPFAYVLEFSVHFLDAVHDMRPEADDLLFAQDVIRADLDRLAALQQDDGGWVVDFPSASPAGSLDWRGYATVRAIDVLRRNGVLDAGGSPALKPSPVA